jgi:hypothetical protein
MKNLILFICLIFGGIISAQTTLFSETFETANSLTLVNGTQTNKWFRGSANQCNGVSSLYISNNSSSYAYTNTSSSIVHAYFDAAIPSGATNIQLSFSRKLNGEASFDFLQVWSVINTFNPTAGTAITANANRVSLGTLQGVTTCATTTYNVANSVAGTTRRFVFTWRNDASAGTQPPALIDNITLVYTPPASPPSNDACSNATSLPCATSNLAGTTVASVLETAPGGGGLASNYGVWYTFTGNGQQTTVSTTGTGGFDQEMTILYGTSCSSMFLITSQDVGFGNGTESYTFVTVNGLIYYIYVAYFSSTGTSTQTGTFTISRTCTSIPDGPCINTFAGITEAMPTQSNPTVISSCPSAGAFADEYMTWTGVSIGTPYIISSSISTDWITIRSGTSNGTVEASGYTPLSWTGTLNGTVYIHVDANGGCAMDPYCRNITVDRISALPVELLYFEGNAYPGYNKLDWATASEWNSDYYEIFESLDGINWRLIKTIDAAGWSNQTIYYSTNASVEKSGIYYYKLKQLDYNGDFKVYDIIAVFQPYSINSKTPITYYNMIGQEVRLEDHRGFYFILYDDGSIQKSFKP